MISLLQNSFIHIPGVSKEKERAIWRYNILHWNEFIQRGLSLPIFSSQRARIIKNHIQNSLLAHKQDNHHYFKENLPKKEHWRVYRDLKHNCCFLDIETTGLSKHRNSITTIGIFDGKRSKVFVQGQNLDQFATEIAKYSCIITFNGTTFDLPFIKEHIPHANLDTFHIDLRYVMKQLGYSGGLKCIEQELGLRREDELADMDGRQAVRLWYRYKNGDERALELLKKYNIADVENLQFLMDYAYEKLREKEFLMYL